MFVEEITYGTYVGGRSSGMMGFTIVFSGEPANTKTNELVDIVEAVYRHKRGFGKLVRFEGVFSEDNDLDLFTLSRSFKNAGYFVSAICNGIQFFSWYGGIRYLIVETDENKWIGFEANELWYHMDSDDTEELTLPELQKQPELYIVPGPEVTPVGIFNYMRTAKRTWNVYLTPVTSYIELVNIPTGDE